MKRLTRDSDIRRAYYAQGYQNALQEIIEIAEAEGVDAALRYARDNYRPQP